MAYASKYSGKNLIFILLILICILSSPQLGHSAVFNVTNEDELRQALLIAESNGEDDVINIEAGLYRTFGEPFNFTSDENYSLTLEGEGINQTTLDGGGLSQVLLITSLAESHFLVITIRGLSIQNGFTTNNGAGLNILMEDGFLNIENCEFTNNNADMDNSYGGGIYIVTTGSVHQQIKFNSFRNNSAQFAGGLYSIGRAISINNNLFTNNFAKLDGGGLAIYWSSSFITNNTFSENSALRDGGCIHSYNVTNLDISHNEFRDNSSGNNGGCVSAEGFGVGMRGNDFYNNSAVYSGGGAYVFAEQTTLSNNLFTKNYTILESDLGGGGIAIEIKETEYAFSGIVNNILSENKSASHGGGLVISYKPYSSLLPPIAEDMMNLTNNTIVLNETVLNGGGFALLEFYTEEKINIYNNITYDNKALNYGSDIFIGDDSDNNNIGSNIYIFNNDFSDFFNECGAISSCMSNINSDNNINEDPMIVDAKNGDFSLTYNSPAIDAGDPDAPWLPKSNGVSEDFFYNPRDSIPDMGAVEFIEEAIKTGGGCSVSRTPVSSSLVVFLVIPILLLLKRFVIRHRSL